MLKANRIGVVMTVMVVAGLIAVTAGPASAIYTDAVLDDNPVLYYRLGEAAGGTAANLGNIGSGGDASYFNSPSLGQPGALVGDPDTSVGLDGGSHWAHSANNIGLDATAVSLEAWVLPTRQDPAFPSIAGRQDKSAGGRLYKLTVSALAPGEGTFYGYEVNSGFFSSGVTPTGNWDHLVMTFDPDLDGGTSALWVNGTKTGVNTALGALAQAAVTGFHMGASRNVDTSPQDFFQGGLDEVALYHHVLSDARIVEHYRQGSVPEPTTLCLLALGGVALLKRRR